MSIVIIPESWYGPKADAADMTNDEIKFCISNSIPYDNLTRVFLGGNAT